MATGDELGTLDLLGRKEGAADSPVAFVAWIIGDADGPADTDGTAEGWGPPAPTMVAFDGTYDGMLVTDGDVEGIGLPTPTIVAFEG